MPHLLVSTKIRLEEGPTYCGDEWSDPVVMKYLGANLVQEFGNTYKVYMVEDPPRVVLDKLEQINFNVVATTGIGQTIVWTLHRNEKSS